MKNLVFRSVLVALCAIAIVGCKKKDEPTTSCMPFAPYLSVDGVVTNEDGLPLDSIQITLQKEDAWWWSNRAIYTNEIGAYDYMESTHQKGVDYFYGTVDWPSEVTVIATDTTGVYETQIKTCPIVETMRYPEDTTLHMYIDGLATVNFVMKKK